MRFSLNPATESALLLRRSFNVPPARVIKAWNDAKAMESWWCPEGLTISSIQWKLKVGEEFRFEYKAPNGDITAIKGELRDVSSEMLVFSWVREGKKADIGGTLVTVEFRKVTQGTEIALTHELLPTSAAREAHKAEWLARLERLSRALQQG
jgi:uncharacterized protein YndB with AHSA1/START domain